MDNDLKFGHFVRNIINVSLSIWDWRVRKGSGKEGMVGLPCCDCRLNFQGKELLKPENIMKKGERGKLVQK